jgi:hypothetical protein
LPSLKFPFTGIIVVFFLFRLGSSSKPFCHSRLAAKGGAKSRRVADG